ncbi:MAG: hypothetical protein WCY75_06325 [Sulfurimonadaceae bacterium]|jgi:predicted small secreted protein|nr:hypothetical protein [Arcobacteraceae bacterium]
MKTLFSLFSLTLLACLFFSGCSKTLEGVKEDTSKNWEATKEGTSKAWESTKEAVHKATE